MASVIPVPTFVYSAVMLPAARQAQMDGDTYWLDIDVGLRLHTHTKIRLYRVLCPEKNEPGGMEAKVFAHGILNHAQHIIVKTHGMSRDRWVADVWVDDGISLADLICNSNFGKRALHLAIEDH